MHKLKIYIMSLRCGIGLQSPPKEAGTIANFLEPEQKVGGVGGGGGTLTFIDQNPRRAGSTQYCNIYFVTLYSHNSP